MSRPDPKKHSPRTAGLRADSDYASWRRSVEEALGGVSFEDALHSRAAGGLELEPLYTAESRVADFDPLAIPGRPPSPAVIARWMTDGEWLKRSPTPGRRGRRSDAR